MHAVIKKQAQIEVLEMTKKALCVKELNNAGRKWINDVIVKLKIEIERCQRH